MLKPRLKTEPPKFRSLSVSHGLPCLVNLPHTLTSLLPLTSQCNVHPLESAHNLICQKCFIKQPTIFFLHRILFAFPLLLHTLIANKQSSISSTHSRKTPSLFIRFCKICLVAGSYPPASPSCVTRPTLSRYEEKSVLKENKSSHIDFFFLASSQNSYIKL